MPKLLKEPFVQKSVRKYLLEKGYGENLQNTDLRHHGVDIKVRNRKYGRYYLVEVKGDPSLRVKSPEGSRNSIMNSAIGQIITRMHTKRKGGYKYGYKYGIAFPSSFRERLINRVPYDVCDKLNLNMFFVNYWGEVEEYDHKKLKAIQNKLNE